MEPSVSAPSNAYLLQSDQINDLALALSKAQGEMRPAKKDADNPFFKSKYADIASVWEACREALSKNELAVVQQPMITNGRGNILVTTLVHKSGQWMRSYTPVLQKDDTAQAFGSGITYARRYSLSAMLGIAPEEDDDGNAASGREHKPTANRVTPERK